MTAPSPLVESPAQACSLITQEMSISGRNIQAMGHIPQQNQYQINQYKGEILTAIIVVSRRVNAALGTRKFPSKCEAKVRHKRWR